MGLPVFVIRLWGLETLLQFLVTLLVLGLFFGLLSLGIFAVASRLDNPHA